MHIIGIPEEERKEKKKYLKWWLRISSKLTSVTKAQIQEPQGKQGRKNAPKTTLKRIIAKLQKKIKDKEKSLERSQGMKTPYL